LNNISRENKPSMLCSTVFDSNIQKHLFGY
jgi:hypothetical protein